MAIAVLMDFTDITQEQYDGILADMNLGGKTPPNAIFHVAGPTEGGWRVVDVWESQEAFDAYARDKIIPLAQKHGMTQPPKFDIWPAHNMLR